MASPLTGHDRRPRRLPSASRKKELRAGALAERVGELLGGQTCPEVKEDPIPGNKTFELHVARRGIFTFLKNRPKLSLNRETTCPKLGCARPAA